MAPVRISVAGAGQIGQFFVLDPDSPDQRRFTR